MSRAKNGKSNKKSIFKVILEMALYSSAVIKNPNTHGGVQVNKYRQSTIFIVITLVLIVATIFLYINNDNSNILPENELMSQLEVTIEDQDNLDSYYSKKLLFSGLLSIDIPRDFEIMSEEIAQVKYPTESRPTLIYTNEDTTVNVAFNLTDDLLSANELPLFRVNLLESLIAAYPSATWLSDELRKINDKTVGMIEFITTALDMDIYNLLIVFELEGRVMLASFNAPAEQLEQWKPIAHDVMNSLQVGDSVTLQPVEQKEYGFTLDDLSIIETNTGEKIALGMTKDEVEKKLGKSIAKQRQRVEMYEYDGLFIFYRDDVVNHLDITVDDELIPDHRTFRNLKIGMESSSIRDTYGEPTIFDDRGDFVNYTYTLRVENDEVTLIKQGESQTGSEIYDLTFITYGQNGVFLISDIFMSEYVFSRTGR